MERIPNRDSVDLHKLRMLHDPGTSWLLPKSAEALRRLALDSNHVTEIR